MDLVKSMLKERQDLNKAGPHPGSTETTPPNREVLDLRTGHFKGPEGQVGWSYRSRLNFKVPRFRLEW